MKLKTAYAMGRDVTEAIEKANRYSDVPSYRIKAQEAANRAVSKLLDECDLVNQAYWMGRDKRERTGEF